jgi:hypothetical protein
LMLFHFQRFRRCSTVAFRCCGHDQTIAKPARIDNAGG